MNITHPIHSPPLSAVLPLFLQSTTADRSLSPSTIKKYSEAVGFFIRVVGDLPVDQIGSQEFQDFKQRLLMRGSGPSHVNGVIHAMKRVLEYAERALSIYITDLTAIRTLRIPRRAVVHLTQEEIEQFMEAIRIQRRNSTIDPSALCFRALVEVLAGSGMRISEALSLDVASINWREHEARIVGKGGKERKVFFSDRAIRWLKRYLEHRQDRLPPLFVSHRTHRRLSQHDAQRLCRIFARKSGVRKHITLHVLRHTFATTLLRNGCPIGHIQGLLGHERLETTCRYYLGMLDEKDLKRAHERFLEW